MSAIAFTLIAEPTATSKRFSGKPCPPKGLYSNLLLFSNIVRESYLKAFGKHIKEKSGLCYSMASVTEAAPWTMAAEQETEDIGQVVVKTFPEFKELLDQSGERHPVTVNYAELLKHAHDYEAQEPKNGLMFPQIRMYFNGGGTHWPHRQVIARIRERAGGKDISPDVEFTDKVFAVWRRNDKKAEQYMEQMLTNIKKTYAPQ